MAQLEQTPQVDAPDTAAVPLERKGRAWLWILVGSVLVIAVGFVATSMMGSSVVYYKTATEVKTMQGQQVRLAGTLVKDSVQTEPGTTRFSITDGTTTIPVVYKGSATTALSTASQPGTQMVAEGALGTDGQFHSSVLLAKCPSKFQSSTGGAANAGGTSDAK
jgi:cytochrome c-type biogenesis protein CcmE